MNILSKRVFACALVLTMMPAIGDAATFATLYYSPRHQETIRCAAQLECTVTLEPGEHLNGGYSSDTTDWDTHLAYIGQAPNYTPELVVRPARAGLHANFVITTADNRTYYLYFVSTGSSSPAYYAYATPKPAPQKLAYLTPPPLPAPTPPSLADVDLAVVCNGDHFYVAQSPSDYAVPWRPVQACTDGAHTYIQETITRNERTNVPVVKQLLGGNHYGPVNYTYYAETARFVVDGVYPQLALVGEDGSDPWSVTVAHASGSDMPLPQGELLSAPGGAPSSNTTQVAALTPEATPSPSPEAAPTPKPRLIPIMDESGRIIAYTFTGSTPSNAPMQMPPPNDCPPPTASAWDGNTAWSRDLRYATQATDALVAANAIRHGALSRGLFGFIKSPLGFIAGQALFDYVSDRSVRNACPRVQNATNTMEALSAAVNALRSHP